MSKILRLLLVATLASLYFNCGGTTDTGNAARITAEVYTEGGDPVAGADVTVCPVEYTSTIKKDSDNESSLRRLTTSDKGTFDIDSLEPGKYNIEVNDRSSSAAFYKAINVTDDDDAPIKINDTIRPYATVNGSIEAIEDTDVDLYVLIIGLNRQIHVDTDGSFIIDDIPGGTFDLLVVAESNQWDTLEFSHVVVESGKEVSIDTSLTAPETIRQTKVFLNTTEDGIHISSDVTNFPVLIRISEEDSLITRDDEDLSHLRFYKENGTRFPAYVESFDAEASSAEVWVLVDTIFAGSDSQFIRIEIDTSESDSEETASSVFTKDIGFYSVYHFNGDLNDATENAFHGIDHNTEDTPDGRIGHARSFGDSSYFTVSILSSKQRGKASISFWFKPAEKFDSSSQTQGIWGIKIADHIDFNISLRGTDFFSGLDTNVFGTIVTKLEDSDTGYYLQGKTTTFSPNTWYHVMWCWGNGGDSLYINGILEASLPNSLPIPDGADDQIGRSPYDTKNIETGEPRYFKGILDEFHFHSTVRSPDWVKLCYINQGDDDVLVKIVSENVAVEP